MKGQGALQSFDHAYSLWWSILPTISYPANIDALSMHMVIVMIPTDPNSKRIVSKIDMLCIINKHKLLASIPVLLIVAISLVDTKTNSRQQIIIASNPAKIKDQEDDIGTSKRRSLTNFSALPEGNRTAHHVIGSPFATRMAPQLRQIELGSEDDGQSEVEPAMPVLIAESKSNKADAVAEIPAEDARIDEACPTQLRGTLGSW